MLHLLHRFLTQFLQVVSIGGVTHSPAQVLVHATHGYASSSTPDSAFICKLCVSLMGGVVIRVVLLFYYNVEQIDHAVFHSLNLITLSVIVRFVVLL